MAAKKISLVLALVAAAVAPGAAQDDRAWQQALADFGRFSQSKEAAERARAAEAIASASPSKHDKQAVNMILGLLQQEIARDNAGKNEDRVSGEVLLECENALKKVAEKDAVELIVKQAKNRGAHPRLRFHLCHALGAHKDALKALIEFTDDKDPKIQIAALDALAAQKDPSAIDAIVKVLTSGDRAWEAKISALAAIDALNDKGDRVIDGLIEALAKCRADETRVKAEIIRLLAKYLDVKNPRTDDPGWWREAKNKKDAPLKEGQTMSEPTKFFGLETKSARIVFILDHTGSMVDPLTWSEQPGGSKEPEKTETGGGNPATPPPPGEKPNPAEEAAKARATELKKKFDEKKVASRIDGLKKELVNTIYNLDKKVQFSIIWYEGALKFWKEELVPATWAVKVECLTDIEKISANGPTDIWSGIEAAFKFAEVPGRPDVVRLDKKADYATVLRGADTFFLMTDGAHNTGKFVQGEGPDVNAFIAEIKKVNALRKVIINTIALGDVGVGTYPLKQGDIDFMKKIAEATGGSDIHIGKK